MSDAFAAPATKAFAVTPSDSTVINCRAIYVGGAGNVAVIPIEGSTAVTFVGALAGSIIPVGCSKVMSTNTTATSIVGLS